MLEYPQLLYHQSLLPFTQSPTTHMSVSAMALPTATAALYPTGGQGAHESQWCLGRAQKGGRLWHTTMLGSSRPPAAVA